MSNIYQVTDNCPDGAEIGKAATNKVGFFGATPVVQQTKANTLAAGDSTTTILTAVNALNTAMVNLGLVA